MTIYSKSSVFWDPETGRFDIKHYFYLINLALSPRTQKEKVSGGGHGAPIIMPSPCPSGSKSWVLRLSYEILFVSVLGLVLSKSWKRVEDAPRLFAFVFMDAKISQKTHWIFQISKDFDHQNMKIVKLNILHKISSSQDFKSIWVRRPCISERHLHILLLTYLMLCI